MMSSSIKSMKQLNDSLVEAGSNLVLIDFFANWCGPCKEIAPKLDELGKQLANVMILKINVDECEDIVEAYDITVLPTFVFLRSKHKLETFTGNDFEKLKEMVIKLSKPKVQQPPVPQIAGQSQKVYGGQQSRSNMQSQVGMIQPQMPPQMQSQVAMQQQQGRPVQLQSQVAMQPQQARPVQLQSQVAMQPQQNGRPVQLQSQGPLPPQQNAPRPPQPNGPQAQLQSQSTIQPPQPQLQPTQPPPRNPERR